MVDIDPLLRLDTNWVFIAMFNCARCGREVTVRHYEGDSLERRGYRHLRLCPGGCRAGAE